MDYPIGDMLTAAFTGPNAVVFGLLNAFLIVAQHQAFISNRFAFAVAASIGCLLGALGGFISAQATVGIAPTVIMQSVLVGGVTGTSSSTLIGLVVVRGLAAVNLLPVSQAKAVAEAIRDPMSPTQPPPKV